MNVSFDIGGVLSKYPNVFRPIAKALSESPDINVFVLTDMHVHDQSVKMVHDNGFDFIPPERIINSDYAKYGERCKEFAIREHKIDLHIDDFPGYCANGSCLNLFVWPNPNEPYYADDWKTDGSEGNFGRRVKEKKKFLCYECNQYYNKEIKCWCPRCKLCGGNRNTCGHWVGV